MKKIYLVTNRNYENTEIVYAASSEDIAKDFIKHSNPQYNIEEISIDAPFDTSKRNWTIPIDINDIDLAYPLVADKLRLTYSRP